MIIPVNLGARSYDIVIEQSALARAGELFDLNRKVLVVTDNGVPEAYAAAVAQAAAEPLVLTVPQGEASKSLEVYGQLLEAMVCARFSRKDCVVAVGGGVVGDLAGFVAATYMRGVDFYNVPTTVLSQVDSSIGGKTAIDLGGYKNTVGAFWQPRRVLIDIDVLETLPARQVSNGLAEAVKMALTSDADLFAMFEGGEVDSQLETIIHRAILVKKAVVEQDERESGLRRVLNFGHTLGHGIEATTPALYHGECVGLGMIGMCAPEVRERLIAVLQRLNLPLVVRADPDKVIEAVRHDKKGEGDEVTVVRVPAVGTFTFDHVHPDDLREALALVIAPDVQAAEGASADATVKSADEAGIGGGAR